MIALEQEINIAFTELFGANAKYRHKIRRFGPYSSETSSLDGREQVMGYSKEMLEL